MKVGLRSLENMLRSMRLCKSISLVLMICQEELATFSPQSGSVKKLHSLQVVEP